MEDSREVEAAEESVISDEEEIPIVEESVSEMIDECLSDVSKSDTVELTSPIVDVATDVISSELDDSEIKGVDTSGLEELSSVELSGELDVATEEPKVLLSETDASDEAAKVELKIVLDASIGELPVLLSETDTAGELNSLVFSDELDVSDKSVPVDLAELDDSDDESLLDSDVAKVDASDSDTSGEVLLSIVISVD